MCGVSCDITHAKSRRRPVLSFFLTKPLILSQWNSPIRRVYTDIRHTPQQFWDSQGLSIWFNLNSVALGAICTLSFPLKPLAMVGHHHFPYCQSVSLVIFCFVSCLQRRRMRETFFLHSVFLSNGKQLSRISHSKRRTYKTPSHGLKCRLFLLFHFFSASHFYYYYFFHFIFFLFDCVQVCGDGSKTVVKLPLMIPRREPNAAVQGNSRPTISSSSSSSSNNNNNNGEIITDL